MNTKDILKGPDGDYVFVNVNGLAEKRSVFRGERQNLEVEINSKAVRLYGKRSQLSRVQNATYRLAEIQYGKFERILFLPTPIDTEAVTSSYTNGFLELRLTKLQREKTIKIPIDEG